MKHLSRLFGFGFVTACVLVAGCGEVVDAADASVSIDGAPGDDASTANSAPIIGAISDQEAQVGVMLTFTLPASDAQNDTLFWSATNLPPNATLDAQTGLFSWTPGPGDLKRFSPEFTVTDDGTPPLATSKVVAIEVRGPYVEVLIGAMTGSEPTVIDSTSHPTLFRLSPLISSVRLRVDNPAAPTKPTDLAGTYRAPMTPAPPAAVPGVIELTITPVTGASVEINNTRYTTSAKFAANPSSFSFFTSLDNFTTPLSVINLNMERTETVMLTRPIGDTSLILQWVATNAFGENGGGQAGFSTSSLTVNR